MSSKKEIKLNCADICPLARFTVPKFLNLSRDDYEYSRKYPWGKIEVTTLRRETTPVRGSDSSPVCKPVTEAWLFIQNSENRGGWYYMSGEICPLLQKIHEEEGRPITKPDPIIWGNRALPSGSITIAGVAKP